MEIPTPSKNVKNMTMFNNIENKKQTLFYMHRIYYCRYARKMIFHN